MSRNAAGTYTAPTNSVNPAVEGTTIDEGDWNTLLDDLESALTDSLDRTGKGKITAHIDFDENASPGTPDANVGRLYGGDDSGLTTLYWKDNSGNVYNLLQGAASGLTYQFSTSTTTTSDPGAGIVRFNHATVSSVTEIAIDDVTAAGADVSAFILTWDDTGTSDRGRLFIQKRTAPGTIAIFRISGALTDESGWTRLAVTYITHAGTFSANDPIAVSFGTPGSAGATGDTGASGANGTDAGIRWLFDSSTAMADPGSGDLRLNHATLASVTAIALSDNCAETGAPDVSPFVLAWDDSTTTADRGTLIIKKVSAPQNFAVFKISGSSTDNSGWTELAVTHVTSSGSFSAADTLAVQFCRSGNSGAGSGDVVGPASSVDAEIALYDGTTGKLIKRASTTGILKAASGVLSAAVAEDLGAGKHAIWIPAAAMVSRTTNGAASGSVEMTTNKNMIRSLDFDATTQEFVQFGVQMPKSWNEGTLTAKFVWSHASTATNFGVVWALEGVATSDGDAGDVAFGTAQQVADTGGTTNTVYVTSETAAITIAGSPAAEDWVMFQVKRVPSDGSDTMAIDARLHGVTLYITTDAITDA